MEKPETVPRYTEKPARAPKQKEAKKPSPQDAKKKVDTSVKKWKKTADKPGHTKGYKKQVEEMFAPIQAEWENMLKKMPSPDTTQYMSALEDLQGKAGQTAKLKPETTTAPAAKPTATKPVTTAATRTTQPKAKPTAPAAKPTATKAPIRPQPKSQAAPRMPGLSSKEKRETQRRKGVLERTKELGGKRLDDPLTLSDTKFTSLNGNGGIEDKDWGKDGEYIRTGEYLNKTIYFGIETAPPHKFTVYTDWRNKIYITGKEDLEDAISKIKGDIVYKETREPLTFAQQKVARDRIEGTNKVIRSLGGTSMDRPLYLAGLNFTFDTSEEEEGNWVNGKGGILARATYKGKEIYFNIERSAPHTVTGYDKSGSPMKSFTHPSKAVLEKHIAARKKEINA